MIMSATYSLNNTHVGVVRGAALLFSTTTAGTATKNGSIFSGKSDILFCLAVSLCFLLFWVYK